MIDARELRIGNLLEYEFQVVTVDIVSKNGFAVSGDELFPVEEDIEHVKPITLTPEWLERMGFIQGMYQAAWSTQIGKTYQYIYVNTASGESGLVMFDEDEYTENNEAFIINFKFVHQLQNLYFSLTGKELEIKN